MKKLSACCFGILLVSLLSTSLSLASVPEGCKIERILIRYRNGQTGVNDVLKVATTNITKLAYSRNPGAAHEILIQLIQNHITPNVVSYNSVINAYAQASQPVEAERVLQEMMRNRITPDVVSYNSVINAYAQASQAKDAERVLQEMMRNRITPNVVSYNSVINAYVNADRIDDAVLLFNSLIGYYFSPNILTSQELDLHSNQFYTRAIYEYEVSQGRIQRGHVPGIPTSLALVLLHIRMENNNPPQRVIVGQHGDDTLKMAVVFKIAPYGYKVQEVPGNPGELSVEW